MARKHSIIPISRSTFTDLISSSRECPLCKEFCNHVYKIPSDALFEQDDFAGWFTHYFSPRYILDHEDLAHLEQIIGKLSVVVAHW